MVKQLKRNNNNNNNSNNKTKRKRNTCIEKFDYLRVFRKHLKEWNKRKQMN